MKFLLGWPFKVYVSNLSAQPILRTKKMVVLYESKAPDFVVHTRGKNLNSRHLKRSGSSKIHPVLLQISARKCNQCESRKTKSTTINLEYKSTENIVDKVSINTLHYKLTAKQEAEKWWHEYMEDCKPVSSADWLNKVEASDDYAQYLFKFVKMLSKFEILLDSHLQWVKAALDRIEISSPEAQPIHSAPYRAKPRAHQLEKNEITQMLEPEVIKPVQTELAKPVVFAAKMTRWSCFAWTTGNSMHSQNLLPTLFPG